MQVPSGLRATEFHAMGTTVTLLLPLATAPVEAEHVQHLFTLWEATLSRFRPTSELSRLNRRMGQRTIVSPLLFDTLTTALTAARATNGVYDPTLLTQVTQAGYDRSFDTLPAHLPTAETTPLPGGAWRDIALDAAQHRVFLPAGAQIDLGGIAKGMAVDAALALLRRRGIGAALVNAGGDLAVMGLPPELDHWPVSVPTGAVIALRRGAMATSGTTRRHWQQGAEQRHHLIDPQTGAPAQSGLATVTVLTDRCEQGEVAAKVAFILGATAGTAFLREHHIAGMLVTEHGGQHMTAGWPGNGGEEAAACNGGKP